MTVELWSSFVLASAVMGVVPGPGVLSIVGHAVGSGRRTALAAVAGMAVGNSCAMTLSLAGVGAVLAASASAFAAVKLAGAAYLIGLGVMALRRGPEGDPDTAEVRPISPKLAFTGTLAVGIFHPKTIVFFVAFVPQFMTASQDYRWQAAILIATFTAVVAMTDTAYAFGAARIREVLSTRKARLWTRRVGGCALIAAGTATALSRG